MTLWVPPSLAPSARELLIAFAEWASEERHAALLADDDWTWTQMIDLFLTEASTRFEEGPDGEGEALPADGGP